MVRTLAFYLPQFHPIPENDAWWGQGFTEWTNVVKAQPQFRGHYQPHLPSDTGFYDLRLPEARQLQADLAQQYGLHGFCYYHYWFNGKRLLERPFQEVLTSGKPDFPFCLCWANEDWTRAWDGRSGEILLQQHYSEQDDREHIRTLAPAFRDPRYVRIENKPLFLVYRASRIPDPLASTTIWREEAHRLGLGELFLAKVESFSSEQSDPQALGFDAAVEFQPDWRLLGRSLHRDFIRRGTCVYGGGGGCFLPGVHEGGDTGCKGRDSTERTQHRPTAATTSNTCCQCTGGEACTGCPTCATSGTCGGTASTKRTGRDP